VYAATSAGEPKTPKVSFTGSDGEDGALLVSGGGFGELLESVVHAVMAVVTATTVRPAPSTRVTADLTRCSSSAPLPGAHCSAREGRYDTDGCRSGSPCRDGLEAPTAPTISAC
jgi:hypothetical protein